MVKMTDFDFLCERVGQGEGMTPLTGFCAFCCFDFMNKSFAEESVSSQALKLKSILEFSY